MGQTHLVLKEKVISFPKGDLASANPSKEADGLWIYFECKDCGKIPMITITQHNGRGYLYLGYEEQDANKDVEDLKKAKKEAKEKGKGKSKK